MGNSEENQGLTDYVMDADDMERVEAAIRQADEDIQAAQPVRVNFRWSKRPLDAVKAAAAVRGIPYQTYMKDRLYETALRDLKAAETRSTHPLGDSSNAKPKLRLVEKGET